MGSQEIEQQGKPKEAPAALSFHHVVGEGTGLAGADKQQEPLKGIPLNGQDGETGKALADYFGGKANLSDADRNKLEGFVKDGMSGNLSHLARLAMPENSAAATAFASMMHEFGYGVFIDQADKSGLGKPFHSVQIVEDGANRGLQLTDRDANGKHYFGYEATINRDGSVDFTKDATTLSRLQHKLSQRLKDAVDKD